MEKVIIHISGMSCGHCEKTVANAIKEVKGVQEVQVDLPGLKAEVSFDPNITTTDKIIEAVNNTEIYTAHA